mgnify:CR=1
MRLVAFRKRLTEKINVRGYYEKAAKGRGYSILEGT